MNKTKITLALTLCLIWPGLTCTTVTAAEAPAVAETPSWLFVQEAASGTLKGPDNQHLTLTLKRVRNYTTAFTDRPIRDAVDIPTQTFISDWDTAFAGDPPNASLSYRLPGQARPQTLILELTSPAYDSKKGEVTYQAALVHTEARPLASVPAVTATSERAVPLIGQPVTLPPTDKRQIKVPSRFLSPSLFIDSTTYCPWWFPICITY